MQNERGYRGQLRPRKKRTRGSVVVGTFAMAQKIENGLRDLCSARGITFDNQYIKSYINPSTLLEYTIHVWRAGEGLRIGIDGDASYEYKKQVP